MEGHTGPICTQRALLQVFVHGEFVLPLFGNELLEMRDNKTSSTVTCNKGN